jgi:hypothetical protein
VTSIVSLLPLVVTGFNLIVLLRIYYIKLVLELEHGEFINCGGGKRSYKLWGIPGRGTDGTYNV